jgi:hypothetical protein
MTNLSTAILTLATTEMAATCDLTEDMAVLMRSIYQPAAWHQSRQLTDTHDLGVVANYSQTRRAAKSRLYL